MTQRILYLDCFSGIAGDMILGALVDLGLDLPYLEQELGKLGIKHLRLKRSVVRRNGLRGTKITVCGDTILNSNMKEGELSIVSPRTYGDIRRLITHSRLKPSVKKNAIAIFRRLARVEARIHGRPIHKIHFHELGAIDSVADIVGACIGIERLGVSRVYHSTLRLGRGLTRCDHGNLPLPAPATLALLAGKEVEFTKIPHELVTPTGASILTEFSGNGRRMPKAKILNIGYGAGDAVIPGIPNLLRAVLCEARNLK